MRVIFVLVEPQVPENVGAALRALKTMGFDTLRVVNSDAHLQPAARWLAHGSADLLERVEVFATLADAVADCGRVVGTSAKPRGRMRELYTPRQLAEQFVDTDERVGIVFGREDRGLSNEEIDCCQLLSSIPLAVSYPSLNLGQAVMLYAYELGRPTSADRTLKPTKNCEAQRQALQGRVDQLLNALELKQGSLPIWTQQRLACADSDDVRLLHSLCTALEKRLAGL